MKKRVVLIGDRKKAQLRETINELEKYLSTRVKVVAVDLTGRLNLAKVKADLVIVLGGDGSIISTARRLGRNQIPVVGVNLGKFGFLAGYSLDELKTEWLLILSGKHKPSHRMMLCCEILRRHKKTESFLALNDAVITRGTISRMIYLRLSVNHKELTTFAGDGIIISTPNGSTAHSLAAGGPLLEPGLNAMVITPICPHTLSMRPLVTPGHDQISLELVGDSQEVVLTIDGQIFMYLHPDDEIRISSARQAFHLVTPQERTFYDTLREKMLWGGQPHSQVGHKKKIIPPL